MCASYSSHAHISLAIDQSGCPHFCLLCIRGSRGAQYVAILRRNIADGRLDQFWQESLLFNDSQAISLTVIPLNRGHCRPFQQWPPVGCTRPYRTSKNLRIPAPSQLRPLQSSVRGTEVLHNRLCNNNNKPRVKKCAVQKCAKGGSTQVIYPYIRLLHSLEEYCI
jgi:hypothetical protein